MKNAIDTNETWTLVRDAYRMAQRTAASLYNGWMPGSVVISDVQRFFCMMDHKGKALDRTAFLATLAAHEGQFTLDEGDYSCATEEQRNAGIMLRDRIRLYIRIH